MPVRVDTAGCIMLIDNFTEVIPVFDGFQCVDGSPPLRDGVLNDT